MNNSFLIGAATFLIGLCLVGIGFGVGMHVERLAWNKLIEEGRLPAPAPAGTHNRKERFWWL